jgi:Rrf2 family protein
MKLSRTVAYALQAVVELGSAGAGATVPSRRLAEAGGIPDRFLLQILRTLVSHGVLHSTRGVEGGYTLARPLDQVSLLDIIEALEGPVNLEFPPLGGREAGMQSVLREATAGLREQLAKVKLSQLLPAPQPEE